jgi:hypothetical protein
MTPLAKAPAAQFEISIDGKPRSYRDRKVVAIEAEVRYGPRVTNRTCRSFFRLGATSGFLGTHNVCSSLSVPIGFTASRDSNRQSCDRDYSSRKEPADAEEHQNIVDFDGHSFSPLMVGRR